MKKIRYRLFRINQIKWLQNDCKLNQNFQKTKLILMSNPQAVQAHRIVMGSYLQRNKKSRIKTR